MEYLRVFDKDGNYINKIIKRYSPLLIGEYIRCVNIIIKHKNGNFLAQKRSKNRRIKPSTWAETTGTVIEDESTIDCAIRELKEELGLSVDKNKLEFIGRFFQKNTIQYVYLIEIENNINEFQIEKEEIDEIEFISKDKFIEILINLRRTSEYIKKVRDL